MARRRSPSRTPAACAVRCARAHRGRRTLPVPHGRADATIERQCQETPAGGAAAPRRRAAMEMWPPRRKTRAVRVGNAVIGGDTPVLVQSMITEETRNVDACVAQI